MNKKQTGAFIIITFCGCLLMVNSLNFITYQILKDMFMFFGVLLGFVLFIVGIAGCINYVREKNVNNG